MKATLYRLDQLPVALTPEQLAPLKIQPVKQPGGFYELDGDRRAIAHLLGSSWTDEATAGPDHVAFMATSGEHEYGYNTAADDACNELLQQLGYSYAVGAIKGNVLIVQL